MIYTSYFSKLKNLRKDIVPIAICGGIPDWYKGLWYRKLAPSYSIWSEWNKSNKDELAKDRYIKRFKSEILSKCTISDVAKDINELLVSNNLDIDSDIVLLCYERTGSFCHRNIVSNWLRCRQTLAIEYNFDEVIPDCIYRYINSVIKWESNHTRNSLDNAEVDRIDAHNYMIDYYDLTYSFVAAACTRMYDMCDHRKSKNGSIVYRDTDIIARDLHSILSYYRLLKNNSPYGWYGD